MAGQAAHLPDLKIEIGLTTIAPSTALYDSAIYDTAVYADAYAFVDVSADVRRGNFSRGVDRSGVLSTGVASIVLDNKTRKYSPGNPAGIYFGQLKPWRPVRLTSPTFGALFAGWVQQWTDLDLLVQGNSETTVDCVDCTAFLAATDVTGTALPSETVGSRITRLIGLTGALVNVIGGTSGITLQASTASGSALQEATNAVLADGGILYVDAQGSLVFVGRAQVAGVYGSPAATITDDPLSSLHKYREVTWELDGTWVANRVTANRLGGPTFTLTDEVAVVADGLRTLPANQLRDVLAANDADVGDLAIYRLGRNSKPVLAPGSVLVDAMVELTDQRPVVALDVNARVDLRRQFPGASPILATNSVRAISQSFDPETWRVRLDLVALPAWIVTPPLYDTAIYDTDVYA